MLSKKLKILYLGIFGLIAAVLIVGIGNSLSHHGKSKTTIEIAPSTAQVSVDGNTVSPGVIYLSPGEHKVLTSLDNFVSNESSVDVKSGKPASLAVALSPANDAGIKYLADNPTYQLQREGIAGREEEGRAAVAETPLRSLLPTTSSDIRGPYSIDYGMSSKRKNGTLIIIGDSSPRGRIRALQWIRSKGFDPTDLEIQYSDYVNPLTFKGTGVGE